MLGIQEVYSELGRCGAGAKLLLVDACREDAVRGVRRSGVDSVPPAPDGVGVLFSCSKGQFAFEAKELKHGVFFYYVLQALKGEVKNKRGEVTWDLLRAHVKEHVPDKVKEMFPGGKQIPNGVESEENA